MAELQARTSVPARWRFLFAAVVVFAFFAAALYLSRPEKPSRPDDAGTGSALDTRLRLQAAAMAFSPGKLDPRICIITDRPEVYEPEGGIPREFLAFPEPILIVFQPNETTSAISLPGHILRAMDHRRDQSRFDLVLLDKRFPRRIYSPQIGIWSSVSMDLLKQTMYPGGVFAAELPPDRPDIAACIMVAMRKVFGNVGTFCFGPRIVAASVKDGSENAATLFPLEKMNENAALAGYYSPDGVPGNAISLVLSGDYSDIPPARLLEDTYRVKSLPGQEIGAADYLRTELLARLREKLPAGPPYGMICAWTAGIILLVYLLMRYFISWKPVHKQAFLAFEDMFYLTGCCTLCLMLLPDYFIKGRWGTSWSPENLAQWPLLFAATGGLFVGLFMDGVLDPFYARIGLKRKKQDSPRSETRGKILRFAAALFVFFSFTYAMSTNSGLSVDLSAKDIAYRLIVFGIKVHLPLLLLFCAVSPLVAHRLNNPVQPGPEIPAAFVLGTVLALTAFAVGFCFPAGPIVFTVTVCGFRILSMDN